LLATMYINFDLLGATSKMPKSQLQKDTQTY